MSGPAPIPPICAWFGWLVWQEHCRLTGELPQPRQEAEQPTVLYPKAGRVRQSEPAFEKETSAR